MTKADRTRRHIIQKTAPVFNRKGYDGTSLSDLTKASGLTKGALYGHFTDKDDIALEAFRYAIGKVRKCVAKELAGYTTSKDQLRALLDFYATYVFNPPVPGGCPLLNAAVEADDHRVTMRKVVTSELIRSVNFIRDLIQRGKENNEFRDDVNPSEIAYTFFCATEGALMFSRAERSAEPMNIVVAHCKKILDQITK